MGDAGADDDDGWAQRLGAAIDAQPPCASLVDAVRPMAGLTFEDPGGNIQRLDFGQVKVALRQNRRRICDILRREGCGDALTEDYALAIFLYTADQPFRIYQLVNARMRAPSRSDPSAPDGLSAQLRQCLPYISFLREALLALPPAFHHEGRCFRGVQWAYPNCGRQVDGSWAMEHEPGRHFPIGRQLRWYEFKSASTNFSTMYEECFCGDRGARTIFVIENVRGYRIQSFSAIPDEQEVLFLPNTRFQVSNVQRKLKPEHLLEDAAPGGFPDEICLTSADAEVAQAVPKELMLKLGRQQINDAPSALLGALLRR